MREVTIDPDGIKPKIKMIKIPLSGDGVPVAIIIRSNKEVDDASNNVELYAKITKKYTKKLSEALSQALPRRMFIDLTWKMLEVLKSHGVRGEYDSIKKKIFSDNL